MRETKKRTTKKGGSPLSLLSLSFFPRHSVSSPSSAEFRNRAAEEAVAGVAKGRLPPFDSLPRLATFPSSFSSFSSPARCSAVAAFFFLDLSELRFPGRGECSFQRIDGQEPGCISLF